MAYYLSEYLLKQSCHFEKNLGFQGRLKSFLRKKIKIKFNKYVSCDQNDPKSTSQQNLYSIVISEYI